MNEETHDLGRMFDDNRKSGVYSEQGNRFFRQAPLTNIIKGKSGKASFSLNLEQDVFYAIISADELQPSHLGAVQNPLHFIPEAQPRNRSASRSGSETPHLIAQNLRPAEIIEGASAYSGAPITNARGEVIQGNGRGYTMKYYFERFQDDPADYVKYILDNQACLGFQRGKTGLELIAPNKIASADRIIENPVIVRMANVDDETAISLGQLTQSDTEAVASEVTKMKSKVQRIDSAALRKIVDELLSADSGDSTLPELIRKSNVLQAFVNAGALRADETELYITSGQVNKQGVAFISSYFLNTIFKDADVNTADVFTMLPDRVKQGLEKATLYLLKTNPDTSINKEISNAVLGLREFEMFRPHGGNFQNWITQPDIFDSSPLKKYNALELHFIKSWAESSTQKEIVQPLKTYSFWVNPEDGDMFSAGRDGLSKRDAIEKVFGIELTPNESPTLSAKQEAEAMALELELELLDFHA